jgi:hypothetical protein
MLALLLSSWWLRKKFLEFRLLRERQQR